MFLETLERGILHATSVLWSWPLIIFIFVTGLIMTVAFGFVQFRHFFTSWKYVFNPEKTSEKAETISPLAAFLSAISASLGNGTLTGMATAMLQGGPGAAFWIFVLGFFTMPIRFAEVVASTSITVQTSHGLRGGPMVYLSRVWGGKAMPYIYAFVCLLYAFIVGIAMQSNSVAGGISYMAPSITPIITGIVLFILLVYISLGGSKRVIKFSELMAPVKVILFLVITAAVLIYCAPQLGAAFTLIFTHAFSQQAITGGIMGFTVQQAIRFGMSRTLNATEAGVGTAGIFFGATGGANPIKSGIMSMAANFLATNIICFLLMLVFLVSGVWNSGLEGPQMVVAAYSSSIGSLGGLAVVILSILFSVGILVGYGFLGLECWLFVTGGRWKNLFYGLYCIMAILGTLGKVSLIWSSVDLLVAPLIICNLYGLLYLLPKLRKSYRDYQQRIA